MTSLPYCQLLFQNLSVQLKASWEAIARDVIRLYSALQMKKFTVSLLLLASTGIHFESCVRIAGCAIQLMISLEGFHMPQVNFVKIPFVCQRNIYILKTYLILMWPNHRSSFFPLEEILRDYMNLCIIWNAINAVLHHHFEFCHVSTIIDTQI